MKKKVLDLVRLMMTFSILCVSLVTDVSATPVRQATALDVVPDIDRPEPTLPDPETPVPPTTGAAGQATDGAHAVPTLPSWMVTQPQSSVPGQISTGSVPTSTVALSRVEGPVIPREPKVGQSTSHIHFEGDLGQLPTLRTRREEPIEIPLRILPGTLPERETRGTRRDRESSSTTSPDIEEEEIEQAGLVQPTFADAPSTAQNWEGMDNLDGVLPPDTVGDVGMTYYIQMVNLDNVAIYTKTTGALAAGPFDLGTLWSAGDPCNTSGSGDVIVLYDQLADRWMLSQFAISGGNYYECVAVSSTSGDPVTGGWYAYTFDVTHDGPPGDNWFNDYPKFGVWTDAYYMTANQYGDLGGFVGGAWAFDRNHLLYFTTPVSYTYFTVDTEGGLLPSDLDGWNYPPYDSPNYLVSMQDDAWGVPFDLLRVYEFDYYQGNPVSSTLSGPRLLATEPFQADICDAFRGRCIPQPDTDVDLESLSDRLMFRLAYRNFGNYEAMVVNHTVKAEVSAGVRWYELRKPSVDDDWSIYQQDTYAPDDDYRWMGSVAMDGEGNIGIGYSVSSESLYPSIRYTGRKAEDPLNATPRREEEIVAGSGSQTHSAARWGDYSAMSVDPADDCTFWYTQEYIQTTGSASWQTRIASFKFPSCGAEKRIYGTVYDADTLRGLPWDEYHTEVVATPALTGTLDAYLPGVGGIYSGNVVSDTYDVTARAYGYEPLTIGGVTIDDDVQVDFPLTPAGFYAVEGTITDADTGYPVRAQVSVTGDPFDPTPPGDETWSDPLTGYYSLTLSSLVTYTFHVEAPGYAPVTRTVGPLSGSAVEDFTLTPDLSICSAPGYESVAFYAEDFEASDGGFTATHDWEWGPYSWSGAGCGGDNYPPSEPHSGTSMWGTALNDCYNNLGDTNFLTLTVDLSGVGSASLSWWDWYDVYENFDHGEVYVNGDMVYDRATSYSIPTAWEWHAVDLSPYVGETATIEFRMYASTVVNRAGWYIDDVSVSTCQSLADATLQPGRIEAESCPCTPQEHTITFVNHTGLDDEVLINYTTSPSVTVLEMPASLGVVPDGGIRPFETVVKIDSDTPSGATVFVTVTASLASNPVISSTAVIEKRALPGWESTPNSTPAWAGTAFPVDGCTAHNADGDWVTYIISDTSASLMPDFVGYHYASNTWFDPGATDVPSGRWAPDWAYDSEYNVCYLTGGANTPGTGTYTETYRFDPVANDFTPLPGFSTVRDFHDSWVGHIDGTKYLCIGGGNSGGVGISSTQCYNLDTFPGSWEPENSVMGGYPTDIWGAADGLLNHAAGDQFWVVAGTQTDVISDTAYYFDDADNSWHVAGHTGQPRYRLEGDFKHGDFYQLGGASVGFSHTPTTVRGRWNGSAWEWEQLADMPNSRMDQVVGVAALHGPEVPETIWAIDGYGDNNVSYVDHLVQCPGCDCRLDLDKTGPGWVYQGDRDGYLITLANAGQCTASATLTDTIPSGAAYADNLACDSGTCWYDSGDDAVYWNGDVPPYSAVAVTFDVTATAPVSTWVVNTARISPTNAILHIYTRPTTDSVQLALDELGYTYDVFAGDDWTGIDFDPYDVVIVGIDGGFINLPSIQKLRADVIDRGKRLVLLGGTNWESFVLGVDQYLVGNDTANRVWAISGAPHMTLFDAGHPLAQGLTSTYTFSDTAAAFYQIRVTDANIEPIAVNGDGYVNYFRKAYAGGDLVWFTNTPFQNYWTDPADFAVIKQIVANALAYTEGSHAFHVTTPPDIAWDRDVYVNGTWVGEPEDGPFSVVPNDTVQIADRLTYAGTFPLFATLAEDWGNHPLLFQEEMHTAGAVACGPTCDWGITLLPGTSERLVKTFHVTDTGTISLTGWLASDETAPTPRTVVLEQPRLIKDGPEAASTGDVIPYTITFGARPGILGSTVLTDTLPAGLAFADALTATYGSTWYSPTANAVYWTNQSVTGTHAFQNLYASQARAVFNPIDYSRVDQPIADLPTHLSLSSVSPDGSNGGHTSQRSTAPRAPSSPGTILWDQPLSITNTNAYADQDFETSYDGYDIYIADDFSNTVNWDIDTIFVPGNLWNLGTSLTNALTLNWQIYADDGGVPDGDPSGDSMSPSWSLSLPPTHTQVTLDTGSGGYTSNVTLTLTSPTSLPPGAWWLVFYPRMDLDVGGQYGRQVSETANGYDAQVVNPSGGFGFPTHWTSIQDSSAWGVAQQDFAFRLEAQPAPAVVTITFNVTVTAEPGDSVVNTADLDYHDFVLSADTVLDVLQPEVAWNKDVYVNDVLNDVFPAAVVPGDAVQIVDQVYVTYTSDITFTLVETWTEPLNLTGTVETSAGATASGTNWLSWEATGVAPNSWHALTKTFHVTGTEWLQGYVTETLTVEDADPQPDDRVATFQRSEMKIYLPLVMRNY